MSNKNTGGPAFPSKRRVMRDGYATSEFEPVQGMSLRQYTAIAMMQGIFASGQAYPTEQSHFDNMATDALRAADTLLALEARES